MYGTAIFLVLIVIGLMACNFLLKKYINPYLKIMLNKVEQGSKHLNKLAGLLLFKQVTGKETSSIQDKIQILTDINELRKNFYLHPLLINDEVIENIHLEIEDFTHYLFLKIIFSKNGYKNVTNQLDAISKDSYFIKYLKCIYSTDQGMHQSEIHNNTISFDVSKELLFILTNYSESIEAEIILNHTKHINYKNIIGDIDSGYYPIIGLVSIEKKYNRHTKKNLRTKLNLLK